MGVSIIWGMITLITIALVIIGGSLFLYNSVLAALVWTAAYFVAQQGGPNDTDNLAAILFGIAVIGGLVVLLT